MNAATENLNRPKRDSFLTSVSMCVLLFLARLQSMPFQLARWYMRRALVRDPGLYIAYHANIAMCLYDAQMNLGRVTSDKKPLTFGERFDFSLPEHRNPTAEQLLVLVLDIPAGTCTQAYAPHQQSTQP